MTGRGWVHAVFCGNKTGRKTNNALCLNEILHGKPRGFPILRGRVLYKQTFIQSAKTNAEKIGFSRKTAQIASGLEFFCYDFRFIFLYSTAQKGEYFH